jgi:hypothetical protein
MTSQKYAEAACSPAASLLRVRGVIVWLGITTQPQTVGCQESSQDPGMTPPWYGMAYEQTSLGNGKGSARRPVPKVLHR